MKSDTLDYADTIDKSFSTSSASTIYEPCHILSISTCSRVDKLILHLLSMEIIKSDYSTVEYSIYFRC